jgi:1-phosphatidylinositol-4-phosphate 5-kinase
MTLAPSGTGVYEGKWLDGMRHGPGTFTSDKVVYEGDWERNLHHGTGTLSWTDGRKYVGTWEANKRHGLGRFTMPNGNIYDGGFVDDAFEGDGRTERVDGGVFVGKFKGGNRNGPGIFTGKTVDEQGAEATFKFEGTWVENEKHGPAVLTRAGEPPNTSVSRDV